MVLSYRSGLAADVGPSADAESWYARYYPFRNAFLNDHLSYLARTWMTADAMCIAIDKIMRNRISSLKYSA
ncbi:hypothetical protein HID58_064907 [Brassica napus]|uniref:Uncharacterized protein n=1 Tax=Brassica napus TaxID=3708 RepID=A0ABQ7ZBN9_BRANA|nr:hypothetical protein HID58_064907 [Brassica napus]